MKETEVPSDREFFINPTYRHFFADCILLSREHTQDTQEQRLLPINPGDYSIPTRTGRLCHPRCRLPTPLGE